MEVEIEGPSLVGEAQSDLLTSSLIQTLEAEVNRRVDEVQALQEALIIATVALAESRDNETAKHLLRTPSYVRETAFRLKDLYPHHAPVLTTAYIEVIVQAAPLHDIGKIGIPDRVLLQPGKYTPEEYRLAKEHTTIGARALASAERRLSFPSLFLTTAREIAQSHHERWDGTGYPAGLAGVDIPLSARLMAVADTYDALVSRRFHRGPVTHAEALDVIRQGRGTQFDPEIADAFLSAGDAIQNIAQKFADTEADHEGRLALLENALAERIEVHSTLHPSRLPDAVVDDCVRACGRG